MRRFFVFLPALPLSLFLSLSLAAGVVHAEALEAALVKQYPAGSVQSVAMASKALSEVTDTRKRVEEDYTESRNACLEKFFMTNCFDRAKERRRIALSSIRKIEVEASAYLRKDKADERDKLVAERQRKAASSAEGSAIPFIGATRSQTAPNESEPDGPEPDKSSPNEAASEKQMDKP